MITNASRGLFAHLGNNNNKKRLKRPLHCVMAIAREHTLYSVSRSVLFYSNADTVYLI